MAGAALDERVAGALDAVGMGGHGAAHPHQMSFAFSEVQAHVNYMLGRGELDWAEGTDGIERVATRLERAATGKRPKAAPAPRRRGPRPS